MNVLVGLHNDVTKARRYTSLVVTIPSQGSAPGWVKSVDAGGKLIVELGHLQAGTDTFVSDNGHTITLVSKISSQMLVWEYLALQLVEQICITNG